MITTAPPRTHYPATPSRLLALRAEGLTWAEVARRAGCSRERVVSVLASVGYWTRDASLGYTELSRDVTY